jgi:hypothetical protein
VFADFFFTEFFQIVVVQIFDHYPIKAVRFRVPLVIELFTWLPGLTEAGSREERRSET